MRTDSPGLRTTLRDKTRDPHDRIDGLMGDLALGPAQDYVRFLEIQYRARVPLERWLAANLLADLVPPASSGLIADDLVALNRPVPCTNGEFTAPAAGGLGVAWVVAGSSLGNRTILAQRRRRGLGGPDGFLSSTQMPAFFKRLLGVMDRSPAARDAGGPIGGAMVAFAWFEATARQELGALAQ